MNTDYELDRELHELMSGWGSGSESEWHKKSGKKWRLKLRSEYVETPYLTVPHYTTDYVLERLKAAKLRGYLEMAEGPADSWTVGLCGVDKSYVGNGDTPRQAVIKLAIALAKAGLIGKEGK